MPGLAKLLVVVLVIAAVWYALRLVSRRPQAPPVQPQRKPAIEAEDLVSCRVCSSYVPMGSRNCGKPGCPRPQ